MAWTCNKLNFSRELYRESISEHKSIDIDWKEKKTIQNENEK